MLATDSELLRLTVLAVLAAAASYELLAVYILYYAVARHAMLATLTIPSCLRCVVRLATVLL